MAYAATRAAAHVGIIAAQEHEQPHLDQVPAARLESISQPGLSDAWIASPAP
jgi:hypothetical protein